MIDWDKPLFNLDKPTPFQKLLKQASKTADKAEKFLNKINSAKLASINRAKSIPPKKCNNKKRICQAWKAHSAGN